MSQDIWETMRRIAADSLSIEEDQIQLDSRLKDDLDADSLQIIELVMDVEDELDIAVHIDRLIGVETAGDVLEVITESAAAAQR